MSYQILKIPLLIWLNFYTLAQKLTHTLISVDSEIKIEKAGKVAIGNEDILMSLIIKLPSYSAISQPEKKFNLYYETNPDCWMLNINMSTQRTTYKHNNANEFLDTHYMEILKNNGMQLQNYIDQKK